MSVAVGYMPAQHLGFESSKQHDLLDALLASCQKPASNPPLPGFGRELQPYFASNEIKTAIEKAQDRKGSPKRGQKRTVSTAPTKANKAESTAPLKIDNGKATRKSLEVAVVSGSNSSSDSPKQAPAKKRSKEAGGLKASQRANSMPVKVTAAKAVVASGTVNLTAFTSWAGPGFYSAPRPDELPVPSAFLLK